jgi:zinc protease
MGGNVLVREVRQTALENGLMVLTVEDRTSPTASLQLFYRVGSRNERPGITGISHIFEHLMFKGTTRFRQGVLDRILQENGMRYNAFTTHDFTCYYEEMASDRLDVALELEADRMQGLRLEKDSFRSEMGVIREERRQNVEDPPFGLLSEAVQASVFRVHPYHWPVIGWMRDLEAITLEDVTRFYRDYYRPNNAVLVVGGDVDHDEVVQRAARYFGGIERGPELPDVDVVEPEQEEERTVSVRKPVQLPGIILTYRAPASHERSAKVLNVVESILLHGRSSRLYRKLIYDEQLAIGLAGGISLRKDPSTFGFHATARPGIAIEKVREAIYEALEDMATHPVGEIELQKAKNAVEADYVFSQESHHETGLNLGEEECRSSWRDFLTWNDEQQSVTPQEIQAACAETFRPSRRTAGTLIPDPGAPPDAAELPEAAREGGSEGSGEEAGRGPGEAS